MKSRDFRLLGFAVAGALAAFALPAQAEGTGELGVIDPGLVAEAAPVSLGIIEPRTVFRNASVASAGVGLRNRGEGAIELGDVRGDVQRAFLYWTVNFSGTNPPATASRMFVQRLGADRSRNVEVVGEVIGEGAGPCWGPARMFVYRARVPNRIVNGNGTYLITLPQGASGLTDGADPWSSGVFAPLYNGASLVVIGTGSESVALYEGPLSGNTLQGGTLAYTLRLPAGIANRSGPARFHQIGSDGQEGAGRGVATSAANVTVSVNGTLISGPGSVVGDSDWNGAAGGPIAQLWDNRLREIRSALPAGNRQMNVEIRASGDCITPVANIMAR